MALLEIPKNPSSKDLTYFEWMLTVFLLVGAFFAYRHGNLAMMQLSLGVMFVFMVLFRLAPGLRRIVFVGWMLAVYPISVVVGHLLFAGIFFLLLTPLGIAMRLLGRSQIAKHIDPDTASYWLKSSPRANIDSYFKQY